VERDGRIKRSLTTVKSLISFRMPSSMRRCRIHGVMNSTRFMFQRVAFHVTRGDWHSQRCARTRPRQLRGRYCAFSVKIIAKRQGNTRRETRAARKADRTREYELVARVRRRRRAGA